MRRPDPNWTPEGLAWLNERPPEIRALAMRLPPWNLYRIKSTGHVGYIVSYVEMCEPDDETKPQPPAVKLAITKQHNEFLVFEREVFGLRADDLEALTEAEIEAIEARGPGVSGEDIFEDA